MLYNRRNKNLLSNSKLHLPKNIVFDQLLLVLNIQSKVSYLRNRTKQIYIYAMCVSMSYVQHTNILAHSHFPTTFPHMFTNEFLSDYGNHNFTRPINISYSHFHQFYTMFYTFVCWIVFISLLLCIFQIVFSEFFTFFYYFATSLFILLL